MLSVDCKTEQTLPIVHWEKVVTLRIETGDLCAIRKRQSTEESKASAHDEVALRVAAAFRERAAALAKVARRDAIVNGACASVSPRALSKPVEAAHRSCDRSVQSQQGKKAQKETGRHTSCAMTCHSLLVVAVTPVPLVVPLPPCVADTRQS